MLSFTINIVGSRKSIQKSVFTSPVSGTPLITVLPSVLQFVRVLCRPPELTSKLVVRLWTWLPALSVRRTTVSMANEQVASLLDPIENNAVGIPNIFPLGV